MTLMKDTSVYPQVKEVIKEALKHLSSVSRELKVLRAADTSGLLHSAALKRREGCL